MLFQPRHEDRLGRLAEQLRRAAAVTPDLMREFIAAACVRLPLLTTAGKATSMMQLIEAAAWTEAALALVETELPRWRVRRLVCEGGEWLCSLSRQPNLPVECDDLAEGRHENLPLAILSAIVEARRRVTASHQVGAQAVPQLRRALGHVVCCDNFA
jgi:hypothetical protein